MEKEKSVIDRIFDENDNDPVVLYSNDMAIEFDQVYYLVRWGNLCNASSYY